MITRFVDSPFKAILAYLSCFILCLFIVQEVQFQNLFDSANFLFWDAEHYNHIRLYGYTGYNGNRVAFFPLFPLTWKFLTVDVYGILFVNSFIFLSSFIILVRELEMKAKEILLYISIPSFIFFYLPYSESFFFLASVLMIIGLKRNKDLLFCLGLFLSILIRPAFVIFLPAVFLLETVFFPSKNKFGKLWRYVIISSLGIFLVATIQYLDTNEWFRFFSAQKNWGNELQLPKFPLKSWGRGYAVGLDAMAFLLGFAATVFLSGLILKLKWVPRSPISKEILFSFLYISGITLLVFIYRGGMLFSLNRFVFATPFAVLIFHFWISSKFKLSTQRLLLTFLFIWLFFLIFESYSSLSNLTKYTLLSLYALAIIALKSEIKWMRNLSFLVLLCLNFSFQLISYVGFLNEKWIA